MTLKFISLLWIVILNCILIYPIAFSHLHIINYRHLTLFLLQNRIVFLHLKAFFLRCPQQIPLFPQVVRLKNKLFFFFFLPHYSIHKQILMY